MTAPDKEKHYSIGQAAERLGITVETLRRWEKEHKIHAIRSAGGIRLFPLSAIERLRTVIVPKSEYLTISQAASSLGISIATLRRWDKEEKLQALRTLGNERVYTQSALDNFTNRASKENWQNRSLPKYFKEKAHALSDNVIIGFLGSYRFARPFAIGVAAIIMVFSLLLISPKTNTTVSAQPTLTQDELKQAANTLVSLASQHGYDVVLSPKTSQESMLSPVTTGAIKLTNNLARHDNWSESNTSTGDLVSSRSQTDSEQQTYKPHLVASAFSIGTNLPNTIASSALTGQSALITGSALIKAGETVVMVQVPGFVATSKVFLSVSDSSATPKIKQKLDGSGFTVGINQKQNQAVTFDWLVVD